MPTDKIIIAILSSVMIMLILIITVVIVVLQARKQSIQQLLKESVYKNKLNDIMLASLKAQMNPHFIFNCLNSIKLYTEENNSAAASLYLSKFSKLVRNMLDNARSEKTMLADEIESLRLYLDMEAMRFKDKMSYEIITSKKIDSDFIEIPPMLIQPYVENAVWHGIMHKEGNGKVIITIDEVEQDNLTITVEDDGVGRAKSAVLKSDVTNHTSHGTQIVDDRIALFNERYKTNASVVITDLYNDEKQPAGTRVTINIITV